MVKGIPTRRHHRKGKVLLLIVILLLIMIIIILSNDNNDDDHRSNSYSNNNDGHHSNLTRCRWGGSERTSRQVRHSTSPLALWRAQAQPIEISICPST